MLAEAWRCRVEVGGVGLGEELVEVLSLEVTYSLHCSSFLGLPFRLLNINLVKPKKGTSMETVGKP